jgi:hypothetical protein
MNIVVWINAFSYVGCSESNFEWWLLAFNITQDPRGKGKQHWQKVICWHSRRHGWNICLSSPPASSSRRSRSPGLKTENQELTFEKHKNKNVKFSRLRVRRWELSGIFCRVACLEQTDVSDVRTSSIISRWQRQYEPLKRLSAPRLHSSVSQKVHILNKI